MTQSSNEAPVASGHAREVYAAIGSKTADFFVISSWRRCFKLYNLDPDSPGAPRRHSEAEVERRRSVNAGLIALARPHLDHAFRLLESAQCRILFSDRDGIVLDAFAPDEHDFSDHAIERWTGADFSERAEGTNALGTSLVEKRPLTIVAGEHFYARNTEMTCSGAPIFGPDGEIEGGLDIMRPVDTSGDPTLDRTILVVAVDVTRRIEVARFGQAFPSARLVLASRVGGNSSALVAVDDRDFVVGATHAARQLLKLTPERMRCPFPAQDLWPGTRPRVATTLAEAERTAIEHALARNGDNVSATARELGVGRGTLHRKIAAWQGLGPGRDRTGLRRPCASAGPRRRSPRSADARSSPG